MSEIAGAAEVREHITNGTLIEGWNAAVDSREYDWREEASCAQTDPESFFPEKGGASTKMAKKVCDACVVKDECLSYALENEEEFGTWGGKTAAEIKKLRKNRAA